MRSEIRAEVKQAIVDDGIAIANKALSQLSGYKIDTRAGSLVTAVIYGAGLIAASVVITSISAGHLARYE